MASVRKHRHTAHPTSCNIKHKANSADYLRIIYWDLVRFFFEISIITIPFKIQHYFKAKSVASFIEAGQIEAAANAQSSS